MYDTGSKSTTLVSPANSADPGTATPSHATMSDDGRLVLYEADKQLILRDIPQGTSTSIATTGLLTHNSAQISGDGSTMMFATGTGLYFKKGTNIPVALPALSGNKYSAPYILTADGVRAGFTDSAKATFYLANLSTKTVSAFPIPGVSRIGAWAMNGDATKIVLEASTTLAPLSYQIYFLDSRAKSVSLISTNLLGLAGNGSSRAPSISADGKTIAFKSEASDLVDGDNNWTQDVFVQDASGNIELLSHNTAGNSGSDRSLRVTVSQDGSTAIFLSAAADLVEGYYNGFAQIFAASLTVGLADGDGDGLPDAWEQTHFGNLDQNATDDPDHDGATNLDELAAHTDPMDAQSVLRLALTTVEENNQLTWLGADGVRYQVQVSNDLGPGPWSDLGQPVAGTGAALSIPVILPAGNEVYYRLVIVP
jgi:Tol biopolymer transport system component